MERDDHSGTKSSMSTKRRQCIVVLGMHRSGTSALAGVLQLLRVDLGKDLMQPFEDNNPKGFFENNKIYHINEAILKSVDSSWDALFPLPENWWQQEHLSGYKQEVFAILKSEFSGSSLFGIKDPRICLLLPLWQQVFRELDIMSSYVLIVRNPLGIAASLAQRNHFSLEKSGLLWMNYMLQAELYSRNYPRVFISFDDLLNTPQKTIDFIARGLNLSFPHNVQDTEEALNGFLTPDLKHYNIDDNAVNTQLLSFMTKYYSILRNLVNRDDISRKKLSKISRLRKDFHRMSKWFYNADVRHIVSELKEKDILLSKQELEIQQQAQVIHTQKQQFQYQAQKIRHQAEALQAQDHIIQQREHFLQAMKNTLSWRSTKPLRTLWNICRLNQVFPKPDLTSNSKESSANINKTEIEGEIKTECGSIKPIRVPNQELIDYVGGGSIEDYRRIGLLNFYLLIFYCHLQPSDRILEPGCGVGRNAQVIAPYLAKGAGIYEGFDICHSAIQWATENITRPYPNVRFTYVDILNDHYNKNGRIKATEYIFPYESEYFDIVFLPSVFTHMMKDEHEHYVRQIIRVLKRGGLLMSWYFLMNDYSKRSIEAEKAPLGFFYECEDVSFTTAPNDPCAVIAYDEKYVFDFYNSVGLDMIRIIYGNWSGKEEGVILDYQDKILLRKPLSTS